MRKTKEDSGITLIALIITIIILLILAGVSLNAIIGDNGVITNAQKAKIEAEEAELWEKVQMVLVEGMGQDLDREKYVEEVNKKFESQGLKAKIGLRADGYAVTYGKYSRKVALLSDDLQILGEIVAIEGSSEVWAFEIKDDGTLRLTGYSKDKKGDIQIPNIIDGKFVTEIGKIFWTSNITSVNIPEGIEIIDESAFFECSELNCKIIFPSSLKEIGDKAFYGCLGIEGDLNSIVEQGIKTGKNAFAKCSKMKGDIDVLINTLDETVTQIEENQFSGFSGLTGTLTIPSRITKIGANAFSKCSGLTAIEFESGSGLKEIGNYAFSQCTGVTNKLDLPDTVTTIGEYAFNECSKLTGVDLSTGLTSLGKYAFYNCSNLSGELKFPSGLNNSGEYAFAFTGELNVNLEVNGVEEFIINTGSFRNSKILSLDLNNRKTNISVLSFYSCTKLESVTNSESITKVGQQGFQGCKFSTINLCGASVLEASAFSNCTSLSELPCITKNSNSSASGVTSIGSQCFNGCSKLSGDVINYLKNSVVTSVGDEAFRGCSNLFGEFTGSIENITSLGTNVFQGTQVTKVTNINMDNNGYLILEENITEIKDGQFDGTTKFVKNDDTEITEIKIPEKVTKIGKNAFSGCTSLVEVEIPNTVNEIGEGAFRGCTKLSKVKLPDNSTFTKLPDYCFYYDTSLKSIELKKITSIGNSCFRGTGLEKIDLSNVSSLGDHCFGICTKLSNITNFSNELTKISYACFENCAFTNLEIPDNVTTIDQFAFRGTKIETMTVGKGVKSIPANLIDNSSSLKSIEFKGNITSIGEGAFKDQKNLKDITISWDKIKTIGKEAFKGCSSLEKEITLNFDCSYDEETTFSGSGLKVRRQTN